MKEFSVPGARWIRNGLGRGPGGSVRARCATASRSRLLGRCSGVSRWVSSCRTSPSVVGSRSSSKRVGACTLKAISRASTSVTASSSRPPSARSPRTGAAEPAGSPGSERSGGRDAPRGRTRWSPRRPRPRRVPSRPRAIMARSSRQTQVARSRLGDARRDRHVQLRRRHGCGEDDWAAGERILSLAGLRPGAWPPRDEASGSGDQGERWLPRKTR